PGHADGADDDIAAAPGAAVLRELRRGLRHPALSGRHADAAADRAHPSRARAGGPARQVLRELRSRLQRAALSCRNAANSVGAAEAAIACRATASRLPPLLRRWEAAGATLSRCPTAAPRKPPAAPASPRADACP